MKPLLLTTQEEEDLLYAANVVTNVHGALFGMPCAYFVTAKHGWDRLWFACIHDRPGEVTVFSV
jgi:hypothetical protein